MLLGGVLLHLRAQHLDSGVDLRLGDRHPQPLQLFPFPQQGTGHRLDALGEVDASELRQLSDRYSANVALDGADDPVYLAPNNVYLNMVKEKYPNLRFLEAREVA